MGYIWLHNLSHTLLHLSLLVHSFSYTPSNLLLHLRVAQFAMCSDVFNAATGIVKASPTTTAIQIASRLFVVTVGRPDRFAWLAMVWAISDATRYAYHLSANSYLATFRYSQYKVLYPIGVSLELMSLLPAADHLALKMGIVAVYAVFFPRMFNHTSKLETHRRIERTLETYASPDATEFKVRYRKREFAFSFANVAKVRTLLSGARFNWKATDAPNAYVLRDYGIQVSWRLAYLVEYAGALVAYPMMVSENALSRVDVWLWLLHYGKRLVESAFVHTFAADTMPLTNIFKNSLYYWGAGFVLGALAPRVEANYRMVALWGICELGNLYTHLYLANLRRGKDSKERVLPTNALFRMVVSPNYGFEILSWVCFALLDPRRTYYTAACAAFALMGATQMYVWAGGKRRRYKQVFGDKYKTRWRVLPLF